MKVVLSFAVALLTTLAVAEEVPSAGRLSATKPPARQVKSKQKAKGRATVAQKPLRVSIEITDGNPASSPTTCKRNLQNRLDDELAKAGYCVTATNQAEASVSATLRGGKLNSRGSRVVWLVTAEMEVVRAASVNLVNGKNASEVVAKERFDAKSGDARAPSLAQKQCADRLCDDVSAFTKDALAKISEKVKVCEVTVTDACKKEDTTAYAASFAEIVGKLSGVYGCRIISTGDAEAAIKVEVLYEASSFPKGVVARLVPIAKLNIAP